MNRVWVRDRIWDRVMVRGEVSRCPYLYLSFMVRVWVSKVLGSE